MKKRLSVLASLALCVTVGGVYATWIYATQEVPTAYATMGVTLTGTSQGGQAGTLTIAGTNVDLTIDDTNDGKIHNTVLTYNDAGVFTITFTPNANAEDAYQDGVDVKWHVGVYSLTNSQPVTAADWKYNGQPIFTVDTTPVTIDETAFTENPSGYSPKYAATIPSKPFTQAVESFLFGFFTIAST